MPLLDAAQDRVACSSILPPPPLFLTPFEGGWGVFRSDHRAYVIVTVTASGGRAALNHRLIAVTPPGSFFKTLRPDPVQKDLALALN